MSVGSGPTHKVMERSTAAGRVVTAVASGIGAATLGTVLGLVAGANIGGNWFTSVSFAGQHGYEASALVGAVVGGTVFGAVGLWWALRAGRPRSGRGTSTGTQSMATKLNG
jgi:hypothetical protein